MTLEDMRKGRCALCEHNEIMEWQPTREGHGVDRVPIAIEAKRSGFLGTDFVGEVYCYVCLKCGYSQAFIQDPWMVPVGDELKTRVIKGPKASSKPAR